MNAPIDAVLSVFDFIKTCLEETNDQFSPRVSNFNIVLRLEKSSIFLVFFVCRSIYASTLPVTITNPSRHVSVVDAC